MGKLYSGFLQFMDEVPQHRTTSHAYFARLTVSRTAYTSHPSIHPL
jgi:hypothetical protein